MQSEPKPKIKDCFIVLEKESSIQIGFTLGRAIKITNNIDLMRSIMNLLDGRHSLSEIANKTRQSQEEIENIIKKLDSLDVLEHSSCKTILSNVELDRYKRQLSYFSLFSKNKHSIQERLKNSKILLIGLGGGGSQVLYSLLSLGFGHITAIDFDTIELHNLNRQILYTEKDVGKLKTKIAQEKAEEINPHSEVVIKNDKIDSLEKARKYIKDFDLVICTADGPVYYIYKWINEACMEKNIPWISLGVLETRGFVGPFILPGKTFCYNCIVKEKMQNNPNYLDDVQIMNTNDEIITKHIPPSIVPSFGILANYLVLDVMYHVTNIRSAILTDKILTF